jgi:hypothetical protein
VLAQRFDHLTIDHADGIPLRGAVDESGKFVTMENATNDRKTIGMNGSGFLEMVARQMTADLQAIAAATPPGASSRLVTKGVSFGVLTHNSDSTWNTSRVEGLPAPSLKTSGTRLLLCSSCPTIRQAPWFPFASNAFHPSAMRRI